MEVFAGVEKGGTGVGIGTKALVVRLLVIMDDSVSVLKLVMVPRVEAAAIEELEVGNGGDLELEMGPTVVRLVGVKYGAGEPEIGEVTEEAVMKELPAALVSAKVVVFGNGYGTKTDVVEGMPLSLVPVLSMSELEVDVAEVSIGTLNGRLDVVGMIEVSVAVVVEEPLFPVLITTDEESVAPSKDVLELTTGYGADVESDMLDVEIAVTVITVLGFVRVITVTSVLCTVVVVSKAGKVVEPKIGEDKAVVIGEGMTLNEIEL